MTAGSRQRRARRAANSLSASRLLLTPFFLHTVASGHGLGAVFLFAVIALSDYADGRIARAGSAASITGRLLDHMADILFVVPTLLLYWHLGIAPLWVPASIAAAFFAYLVDSWRQRAQERIPHLIGSRIGHAGGVMNWVLIGTLVGNETLGLHLLPAAATSLMFSAVPVYCAAAIVARLPLVRSSGRGGSPAF